MLKNKVVVVAGGCGRLGRAFSKAILDNNGICVIADINEEIGRDFLKGLKAVGYEQHTYFYSADLSSFDTVRELISQIHNQLGRIDALVNTSYPRNENWGKHFFEDVDFSDFCENTSLHLGGYFLVAQQICKYFKKQGYGNIIQIASIQGVMAPKFDTYEGAAYDGFDMNSPAEYSIIKAGIIHFTKYLAKYYKGCDIRSNCISPGGILSGQSEIFLKKYKNYCLSKGMLDAEDISGTLIYLLSDMSKYVNGQNIVIDDGWSL
jgi:NAD(P)-dependent dehydrogenase (short-subunit alcohol dehydrogenase family)